jgi:hypothetical protein
MTDMIPNLLLCLYGSNNLNITSNKTYTKIKQNKKYYLLLDDIGEYTWYRKYLFKEL